MAKFSLDFFSFCWQQKNSDAECESLDDSRRKEPLLNHIASLEKKIWSHFSHAMHHFTHNKQARRTSKALVCVRHVRFPTYKMLLYSFTEKKMNRVWKERKKMEDQIRPETTIGILYPVWKALKRSFSDCASESVRVRIGLLLLQKENNRDIIVHCKKATKGNKKHSIFSIIEQHVHNLHLPTQKRETEREVCT